MRRLAIAALAALSWTGLVAGPAAVPAAASLPAVKVVVIAGPVGSSNAHYQSDADDIAARARKYSSKVIELKSPRATWSRVEPALQGASIVVYLGHGNGWPSIYPPFQEDTKDGLGLDPETGADGSRHVYIGANIIRRDIVLAPNAVVLFHHLCYASGNTEPGLGVGSLSDIKQRPDNYASGFIAAGARAVIADVAHPHTTYIDWLFTRSVSYRSLFYNYPTYHGHPILMDSIRSPGFKEILDPTTTSGPWYRSIVYDPHATTTLTTRTRYTATNVDPTSLVVPGAAEVLADQPYFSDATLTLDADGQPAGTLAAGTRLRLTSTEPTLPDATPVYAFATLDGAITGFVAATGLVPRDSSAPKLWTFDAPVSWATIDGTYPFAIGFRASEPVAARVTIRNAAGVVVKTALIRSAWTTWTWNLVGDDGTTVPNGTYSWSLSAADSWGNTPAVRSGSVALDRTDPRSTAAVTSGTLGQNGWYVSAPSVSVTTTDTGSGVHERRYSLDSGSSTRVSGAIAIKASGTHTFKYHAIDNAGNVEGNRSLTVKVDLAKPVTTATATGTAGTNGWFRGPVQLSLAATDAHSGVAGIQIGVDGAPLSPYTAAISLSTEGIHSVRYAATDRAGNIEATKTTTIRIDATAPTSGAATMTGPIGESGWFTGPVTVGFSGGADAVSGFAGYRYVLDGGPAKVTTSSSIPFGTAGSHTLAYGAIDVAGNLQATRSLAFRIDPAPPAITTTVTGGPAGDAGTYRGPVTVAIAATDGVSGLATLVASVDGASPASVSGPIALSAEGAHRIAITATDRAGNVSTRTVNLVIDLTEPSLGDVAAATSAATFSPNGDGYHDLATIAQALSEPATIGVAVRNSGGIAIRTFSIAATGPGSITWDGRTQGGALAPDGDYTVTLTPTDGAGNVGAPVTVAAALYASLVGPTRTPTLFYPQDGDAIATRTTISATLRSPATVRTEVVNATGTVVRTIDKALPAGPFSVAWNGRNDAGAYVPQGPYTVRLTAGDGSRSETRSLSIAAEAFRITPSLTTARRGRLLTVTVNTAEPLSTTPRLTVRQPGLTSYSYALTHISGTTWRVTFTVRSSSQTGTMRLTVSARDRDAHAQSTSIGLPVS